MRTTRVPTHPGAVLREDVINSLGLSLTEVALRLGVSRVTLSRVVNEHAGISPNLAVRLELAGVSTARAWLALQMNHDLAIVENSKKPKVKKLA
ncbi:MAG: addiction module antidote protein HigA family [Actinomycetota bacterium]|jgi:addiction module HigA family antidote